MAEILARCSNCRTDELLPASVQGQEVVCHICHHPFIAYDTALATPVLSGPVPAEQSRTVRQWFCPHCNTKNDVPSGLTPLSVCVCCACPLYPTLARAQCQQCGAWNVGAYGVDMHQRACKHCHSSLDPNVTTITCSQCGTRNGLPVGADSTQYTCPNCRSALPQSPPPSHETGLNRPRTARAPVAHKTPRWVWYLLGLIITTYGILAVAVRSHKITDEDARNSPTVAETRPAAQDDEAVSTVEGTDVPVAQPAAPIPPAVVPDYRIVHTLNGRRFDGATEYYLLISPVNLSDSRFQEDARAIIRDMVRRNGNKITIEIHDSARTLEIKYQQYGSQTLGRPRTTEEDEDVAQHEVATYQGDNPNGAYLNTLCFYPNAFDSTPRVGQYVSITEFSP